MQEVEYHILSVGNSMYSEKFVPLIGATGSPTITLIISGGKNLLVDPGYGPYEDVGLNAYEEARKLKENIAKILGKKDMDLIFITHQHEDHCNLTRFFSAPIVEDECREILPGVISFATPGHFPSHHSLEFKAKEGIIVVAGDAIINKDYFYAKDPWERIYRANSYKIGDMRLTNKTIKDIKRKADYIIPGHGDKFKLQKLRISDSAQNLSDFDS